MQKQWAKWFMGLHAVPDCSGSIVGRPGWRWTKPGDCRALWMARAAQAGGNTCGDSQEGSAWISALGRCCWLGMFQQRVAGNRLNVGQAPAMGLGQKRQGRLGWNSALQPPAVFYGSQVPAGPQARCSCPDLGFWALCCLPERESSGAAGAAPNPGQKQSGEWVSRAGSCLWVLSLLSPWFVLLSHCSLTYSEFALSVMGDKHHGINSCSKVRFLKGVRKICLGGVNFW